MAGRIDPIAELDAALKGACKRHDVYRRLTRAQQLDWYYGHRLAREDLIFHPYRDGDRVIVGEFGVPKVYPLTYVKMDLKSTEEATAVIDKDGNVTLTGGTEATNATDKALTLDGTVKLDNKTVNTAEAVEVTATADGLKEAKPL